MSIELTALQQQRRDTAANWTGADPTLLTGELGYETDTGKFKIGDGSTAWTSLSYLPIPDVNGLIPIDQLLLPAGTAAAPSLTFTGDVNTGVYSPGADQFGISTGGTAALTIDSSQRVGVGTTSPVAEFQVGGSGQQNILIGSTNAGGARLVFDGDSDGDGAGGDFAEIVHTTGGHLEIRARNPADDATMRFEVDAGEAMRIDSSGRLGVGTSSPSALAHLSNTSSTTGYNFLQITAGGESQVHTIKSTISTGRDLEVNSARTLKFTTGSNTGSFASEGHFQFSHETNGDLVRITADGKVGVGTTSPDTRMTIAKNSNANFTSNSTLRSSALATFENTEATTAIVFKGDSTNPDKFIFADNEGGTQNFGLGHMQGGVRTNSIQCQQTGPIIFNRQGSENGRFDSSGRLLVGTSSSRASAGVSGQMQIEGTNYNNSSICLVNNGNDNQPPYLVFGKSRSGAVGGNAIVQNNDNLGLIQFAAADGSDLNTVGAGIQAMVDGTPGANDMPTRLVFSTTANGASSPTEALRITENGELLSVPTYNNTVATAANVTILSSGKLYRSTSSSKYKTNIEPLQDSYADALLGCRPVWYRSTCRDDNPDWGWWGFIAEEVAAIDPRLVHWKTTEISYDENGSTVETPCEPEAEGVAYDRFVPHLLNLIKRQGEAIAELQAEVAALKGA